MPFATEIHPISGTLATASADLIAVPVGSSADGPTAGADPAELGWLEPRLPAPLADLAGHYELGGKPGEIAQFPVDLGTGLVRLALFGVGEATSAELRAAGAALARAARGRKHVAAALPPRGDDPDSAGLTAFAEGALLASYTYTLGSSPGGPFPPETIEVAPWGGDTNLAVPLHRGTVLARATALARDLINTPAARKDPAWLAARAGEVGADAGLDVTVWTERDLREGGFGAMVGVGQGSARPPRLVRLDYRPEDPVSHVVLVGKGITFDTGGLSLKPNDNMKLMKTDMSGAAAVLGAMSALAELGSRVRVTALLAAADNAFSGAAQRPGDVLTTYSGRTVEVLNTDAEGRLVMADAMGYAAAELDPDVLVDVATLTGAAKLALGTGTGALFSTDDTLAGELADAAERSGEAVWRMPLVEEYRTTLRSRVADLANIGTSPEFGGPGATDAALFLREFAGELPWAHLDIAGPGRATSDDGLVTKGGTGFSTRLLLRWLT